MTLIAYTSLDEKTAQALAQLRLDNAEEDNFDSLSTMESLPSAEDLSKSAETSDHFKAISIDDQLAGYALVRSWIEAAGPHVYLCDWYLAPAFRYAARPVLQYLEFTIDSTDPNTVFGTNASSVQTEREQAIVESGYEFTFAQIEMELKPIVAEPQQISSNFRMRDATASDAQQLINLTHRVWKDREFFTFPTVDMFNRWLERSDLSLFNVVLDDETIIGFVASKTTENAAEIEDVQVDPRFQRQGIASFCSPKICKFSPLAAFAQ